MMATIAAPEHAPPQALTAAGWRALELFPTAVRGSAISLVFDVTRYVAAAGPLLAGWLIVNLGGVSAAASIIGLSYPLGLIVTPFAAPETKGRPLPA